MLERRPFGKTGIEISRLALGGLPLCTNWGGEGVEIIKRAAELGINYIDTAPSYHDSEEVIGKALRKYDIDIHIGTKMGNLPCENYRSHDRDFMRKEFEASLKRLERDYVNVLYVHEPDRPEFYNWWSNDTPYEGAVLDVMEEARAAGKVRFFGLGGTTTLEMARLVKSRKFDVVLTAFQYSLLWQEARFSVLPAAKEVGMGVLAGSPLQQGALAKMYVHDIVEEPMRWLSEPRRKQFMALYELVNDCGIPLPELGMRFVLSNPNISAVLTGVDTIARLESNVESALKGPLPQNILDKIEEIYQMVPFRPFGEPFSPYFAENIKAIEAAKKLKVKSEE